MTKALVERLRARNGNPAGFGLGPVCDEAADEIERLTACLAKANEQAERYEREWYLRGDEVDRLRHLLDTRPALNAGLAEEYVRWTGQVNSSNRYEAAASIKSERQANATLTEEVERLRKDAEMLRVSNDRLVHDLDRAAEDAQRYRWLRDNPRWSVSYRRKPRSGITEWRMRDDGEYWGSWWPTHAQAVDAAMKGQR